MAELMQTGSWVPGYITIRYRPGKECYWLMLLSIAQEEPPQKLGWMYR